VNVIAEQVAAAPRLARPHGLRRGRTWFLAAADVAALATAWIVTDVVSNQIGRLPAVSGPAWLLIGVAVFAVPFWLALFTAYDLYDNDALRISVSSFDEVRDVFHVLLLGSLFFLIVSQGLRYIAGWWISSAVEAAIFASSAIVLVPLARGTVRSWVFPRVMERRRTLIVGTGAEAQLVHDKLERHPEYGLDVVGFVGERSDGVDVVGPLEEIAALVERHEVDRVLLAGSDAAHDEALDLVRTMRRPDVQISIVPSYSEIFTAQARLDDVEGMPVVTLPPIRLGRSARLLKRSMDVVLSAAALVLLSPLLALVALAIRLDSPGAAIFRQPRRGRGGSAFSIAKFRTMHVDAERRRMDAELVSRNEVDGPLFKIKTGRDPRFTRIGPFLRRTSLDELPQLWNVLRGDMSLVGPRPFVIYEADQITGWGGRRLDMTPGITGLWQVLGRNDLPFEEMVKLDYLYVTNWSVWWDLKILCQTIPVVLAKRGAY
jgi:exopolysaccharide biosynthesis polyprenyl glycosylphosphotransferase